MILDMYNNPIYNNIDLFKYIYEGYDITKIPILLEHSDELSLFKDEYDTKFVFYEPCNMSIDDFDINNQQQWFMPAEYYEIDIRKYCLSKCKSIIERKRVIDEYKDYEKRNMIQLLQWIKYFIDTCNEKNIFWGVGRGSSTASYILYLLGAHRIDSIKYELDWKEFLK